MTTYFKVIDAGFKTRDNFDWFEGLKSGSWIEEKDVEISNDACGKGLHVWKDYPRYTVIPYLPDHTFEVEVSGLLGQDEEKARYRKVKILRLVPLAEIFKSNADLCCANLSSANLYGAHLSSADLYSANLSSANLYGANLSSANLSSADLSSANLYGANLSNADLSNAKLCSADLCCANLSNANLYGANLYGADLSGAHGIKDTLSETQKKQIIGEPHC